MDFSDPEVWKEGVLIILTAPHIVGPALGLFGWAAWSIRGFHERGSKGELKEHLFALEERLHLAHDKEAEIRERLERAENQLRKMNRYLSEASKRELKDITSAAITIISETVLMSKGLSKLLTDTEKRKLNT